MQPRPSHISCLGFIIGRRFIEPSARFYGVLTMVSSKKVVGGRASGREGVGVEATCVWLK